jgi:hypothetical protein
MGSGNTRTILVWTSVGWFFKILYAGLAKNPAMLTRLMGAAQHQLSVYMLIISMFMNGLGVT